MCTLHSPYWCGASGYAEDVVPTPCFETGRKKKGLKSWLQTGMVSQWSLRFLQYKYLNKFTGVKGKPFHVFRSIIFGSLHSGRDLEHPGCTPDVTSRTSAGQ